MYWHQVVKQTNHRYLTKTNRTFPARLSAGSICNHTRRSTLQNTEHLMNGCCVVLAANVFISQQRHVTLVNTSSLSATTPPPTTPSTTSPTSWTRGCHHTSSERYRHMLANAVLSMSKLTLEKLVILVAQIPGTSEFPPILVPRVRFGSGENLNKVVFEFICDSNSKYFYSA